VPFSAALIFVHTTIDVYRDVKACVAGRAA
jgi:hypothetical protein